MKTTHTLPILKFVGDFAELKHMGFRFQKLYARNYMTWWRELEEHGDHLIVWRKDSLVEINDHYAMSGSVVECMLNYEPTVHEAFPGVYKEFSLLHIAHDKKNGKLVPYDKISHSITTYQLFDEGTLLDKLKPKMIEGVTYDNFYDKWDHIRLCPDFVAMVRELWDLGVIETVEEERTFRG